MSRQEKATLHPADGEEIEIKYQVVVNTNRTANQIRVCFHMVLYDPVAPVAYQVILEPGISQFREFEPRRVHTRINSSGHFLVHKLTCGKRESVS